MGFFPTDIGAQVLAKRGFTEYEPADDTEIKGEEIDRIGAQSCLAIIAARCTVASGEGPTNTLKLEIKVEHSETTDDGDFSELASKEVEALCTHTGVADLFIALPVDLAEAKQYIRVNGTLDSNDVTFTIDDEALMVGTIILGGLVEKPDDAHDKDGYTDHDLEGVQT